MIRLRNKWVEMDPRQWNADMDLSISVGLGIGNKAQQIAVADGILQTIAMAKQDPAASTLFPLEKMHNAIKRKFTAAGIKNTDEFIQEPQRDEQGNVVEPQLPPDPQMQEAQAKLQIESMKAEHKAQMDQAALEQKTAEAMHKIQLAGTQAEQKAQLEQQRALFEADLAERKFAFEAQMALLQAQLDEHLAHREQNRQDEAAKAKVQNDREGGNLSK
jgi:type IV secretory pathway VirB10-like protein